MIVQIATTALTDDDGKSVEYLYVLCDDGHLFVQTYRPGEDSGKWIELDPPGGHRAEA